MTDHERAFLTAIAAEPDADVHRLIYADWLDEKAGEATLRGEFIRVQCELTRRWPQAVPTSEVTYSSFPPGLRHEFPQFDQLRRREKELLATEGPPILGVKSRHRNGQWETLAYRWAPAPILLCDWWEFRRGFISRIDILTDAFLQHAADIIEAVPMLEEVRLTDKEPWLDDEYDPDWSWFDDVLPRPLYSLMLKLARSTRQLKGIHEIDGHWVSFDTPENARIALSVVCLSFAREQLARRRDPKKYARPRSVTYP